MARRFRKKAGFGIVSLPGLPGLGNDTIVEGDEYARFCPAVLEEIFGALQVPSAMGPVAEVWTRPTVVPSAPAADSAEKEFPVLEEIDPPSMSWLKSELVEYADSLSLDVSGMTKAQILQAIQAEEKRRHEVSTVR